MSPNCTASGSGAPQRRRDEEGGVTDQIHLTVIWPSRALNSRSPVTRMAPWLIAVAAANASAYEMACWAFSFAASITSANALGTGSIGIVSKVWRNVSAAAGERRFATKE